MSSQDVETFELNALIDEQLEAEERAALLIRAGTDRALAEELCRLRNVKDTVRAAYAEVPRPPARRPERPRVLWAAAASLLLLLGGGVIGWQLHSAAQPTRFAVLDPNGRGQRAAVAADSVTRIVFHLTQPNETLAGELLEDVEQMLEQYRRDSRSLRIEIVAHGEGLGLLRRRLSAHAQRIAGLAARFDNLVFVACQNTIDRLRVEQGVEVVLVPEAKRIESGVAHVIRRQQDGWTYIRV